MISSTFIFCSLVLLCIVGLPGRGVLVPLQNCPLFPFPTVFPYLFPVLTSLHTKFPHPQHLVVPIFPRDQSFTRGERWAGANRVGVIPFCAPENGGLHKIVQPFIFLHSNSYFSAPHKRNNTEGNYQKKKSNIIYYQNDGI